jgi:hypothetical protein
MASVPYCYISIAYRLASLTILFFASSAASQEFQPKTVNVQGVEFSYSVLKTDQGKEFGYFVMNSRWPSSPDGLTEIHVCWEDYRPAYQREYRLVQEVITETWQKHSKLRFKNWSACSSRSSGIRINVSDEGPHTKGLGRGLDEEPAGMVLNFTFNAWGQSCKKTPQKRDYCIKSIVVHEFGHAIGFAHEQNRPDTPGECQYPAQGPSVGAEMLTPYDPSSVMNYCNEKFNNDGELSKYDVIALQKVYGGN